jgi:predicted DCC family thiol-disulfide oxidoreductase YuxK
MSHPILLYDGICGLCNRFVQFVLQRDLDGMFRFAALQSPLAARILARHRSDYGSQPPDLATVYVVVDYDLPEEKLFARSDAVIFVLKQLAAAAEPKLPKPRLAKSRPKLWRFTAFLLGLVPRPLRDFAYNVMARYRYRIFGRYDSCPLPTPDARARFLDDK